MKKKVFMVVAVLLAIAFGVSAFMVGSYLLESKQQAQRREELAQMAAEATSPSTEASTTPDETEGTQASEETEPTEPTMIPSSEVYYNENPDTVGYLEIPGTKLMNPVVQTPDDPNYYLKRDFGGNQSDWGTVYAWGSADVNRPSDNVTLFGHNMIDGSMFACLHNYTKKEYWEENQLIIFNTLYEAHTYRIFAVFKINANIGSFAYHQFVDAETPEDFNDFVSTCSALSIYDTGITPVYGDKILTLSTCAYYTEDGRYLDNGRLVVCAYRIS